jgi:hypothetical protein
MGEWLSFATWPTPWRRYSWEANCHLAVQEMSCFLQKP